jgi:hypothetical protein
VWRASGVLVVWGSAARRSRQRAAVHGSAQATGSWLAGGGHNKHGLFECGRRGRLAGCQFWGPIYSVTLLGGVALHTRHSRPLQGLLAQRALAARRPGPGGQAAVVRGGGGSGSGGLRAECGRAGERGGQGRGVGGCGCGGGGGGGVVPVARVSRSPKVFARGEIRPLSPQSTNSSKRQGLWLAWPRRLLRGS